MHMRCQPIGPILLTILCACGLTEEKEETNDAATSADNSVVVIGTLNIGNEESSSLTADKSDLSIECETYKDPVKTCSIAIDDQGQFEQACTDIMDHPFGCVLMEGENIVSNLAFDEIGHIIAGRGNLKMSVGIDAQVGGADSTIDRDESSALEQEAIAAAEEDLSPTIWEQSISGSWKVSCTKNEEGLSTASNEYCPDGQTVYFAGGSGADEFTLWKSQTTYLACTATNAEQSYSQSSPHWHLKISGDSQQSIPFTFTNLSEFNQSMDNIYTQLPNNIKTSIDSTAEAIRLRALLFKGQIERIRKAVSSSFAGVLTYRVPDLQELKRRLTLRLIHIETPQLNDLSFCSTLILDDTILSAYRRIHSIVPEMLCQFKADRVVDEVITFTEKTRFASCMPKLFYDVVFNPEINDEEIVLKCPGSPDKNGNCFDNSGNYLGDIIGKFSTMTLTNHYEDVFDLYQSQDLELNIVHPQEGVQSCLIKNRSMLKGKKSSDDLFSASFSEHFVDRCQGSGANEESRDYHGSLQNNKIKRYSHVWHGTFTRTQ